MAATCKQIINRPRDSHHHTGCPTNTQFNWRSLSTSYLHSSFSWLQYNMTVYAAVVVSLQIRLANTSNYQRRSQIICIISSHPPSPLNTRDFRIHINAGKDPNVISLKGQYSTSHPHLDWLSVHDFKPPPTTSNPPKRAKVPFILLRTQAKKNKKPLTHRRFAKSRLPKG